MSASASQSWRFAGVLGCAPRWWPVPGPGIVRPGGHVALEKQPQQHRHGCDAGRHVPVKNELWVMAFARLELERLGAADAEAEAGLFRVQLPSTRARAGVALEDAPRPATLY
jgi:hypothetical protein